ncbi:MAG: hypothetical protein P4L85_03845 [Paludisphaera borealis]|uniref:hypothetical protein n=1 Tax=Paludisphaera borealis TaxID=1387353 RepID=UPI00284D56FC|nr:hypothetical protein [Paludisphaera borealis]MDR3618459.1 hypothetical protein [Paludisphaera borealis]
MSSRFIITLFLCAIATLSGCDGGTSSSTDVDASKTEVIALKELGEMYALLVKQTQKPPEAGKELMKFAEGFSHGSMAIQNKTVGVYWGAPIEKEGKAVLAYEAKAPEAGGLVLLSDGETVKPMTAEEFQAAPKAPGKLEEPGKPNAKKGKAR